MNVAVRPAREEQDALAKRYRKELAEYKNSKQKEGEEAPVLERTVVEDITVEALADVLEDTPRGVLATRDELAAWVKSMNQYRAGGKGADRQFWLSVWSNNYVVVDRRSREEPLMLQRPFVGVIRSMQPGILRELGEGREDGMLDRFVFCYPEPVPSRWTDDEISAEARESYRRLYDNLRRLHMTFDGDGGPTPTRVTLSPDAKEVIVDAINQHREEMELPGFPPRLKGPWSKLEAYLVRLCLILAMARTVEDGDPERVEADDVVRALVLLDYLKAQTRRVHAKLHGENEDDRLAEDLARFLWVRGGHFRGQPIELHAQLKSKFKPRRPDELSKKVKAVADQHPSIGYDSGHEPGVRDDGGRTTHRFVELTLKIGVNAVNGVSGGAAERCPSRSAPRSP
jgi:hypothetical protein